MKEIVWGKYIQRRYCIATKHLHKWLNLKSDDYNYGEY